MSVLRINVLSAGREASFFINDTVTIDCSPPYLRNAFRLIYGGEPYDTLQTVSLAVDLCRFGDTLNVNHIISLARTSCIANPFTVSHLRIFYFDVRVNDVHFVGKTQNYSSANTHYAHVVSSPHLQFLEFD